MKLVWALLFVAFLPLHWIVCRLTAKRCPRCYSRFRTELVDEWDGEDWHCRACNHWWTE